MESIFYWEDSRCAWDGRFQIFQNEDTFFIYVHDKSFVVQYIIDFNNLKELINFFSNYLLIRSNNLKIKVLNNNAGMCSIYNDDGMFIITFTKVGYATLVMTYKEFYSFINDLKKLIN
ncbi:MAG: hypothetical protein KatS3mg002_0388 [Candidatus Woesearchaeota archaeon]|nr:MAG: hypothetical protein KatS3mg002_0388 [Candidatus Woesearchaeota archaeon]